MITIISSTNRSGAYTRVISGIYSEILEKKGQACQIIDLADLPEDFVFSAMFEQEGKNPAFNRIQLQIQESQKFIFIIPEYNGSFPGILKAFIDGLSYPTSLKNKVGALVGVSSGSMGGALAISHFSDILNYLGMHVLPIRPRLAGIEKSISQGKFSNDFYSKLLDMQADQLVNYKL